MPVEGETPKFEFKPLTVKPKEENAGPKSPVTGFRPLTGIKEMSNNEVATQDQLKETQAMRVQKEASEQMPALIAKINDLEGKIDQLTKLVQTLVDQKEPKKDMADAIIS